MSASTSDEFAGQVSEDTIPKRRFILGVQQLRELPPFYLDAIEVYRRDDNRLTFLDRQVVEMLTSLDGHPTLVGLGYSRQAWDNLEVVIPDVEKSSPLDSSNEIHRAYHLAVVIAGDVPRITEELPPHLQVVNSCMDTKLHRSSPLHRMPGYFMESVHVSAQPFRKEYSSFSNSVTLLTYSTPTARVSIDSELDLCKGTIEYMLELIPGSRTADQSDATLRTGPRVAILVWNCRGVMNDSFTKNMMGLLAKHKPCVLILTDTRVDSREGNQIIEKLPFTDAYASESVGRSGGVWFLYQQWKVKVNKVRQSEGGVYASLQDINETAEDSD